MRDAVTIVDENDQQVAVKKWYDVGYEDIYRVSALWLFNTDNTECLILQRTLNPEHNDPGKWMPSVAGTVDAGETYEQNMVKEIEEEIGLSGLELKLGPKRFVDDGKHRFFVQTYTANVKKDEVSIVINTDEAEACRWIGITELAFDVQLNPDTYVPGMYDGLKSLGLAS